MLNHVRADDKDGGPPPWVPFGKKIQPLDIDMKDDEKSLKEKEKVIKDEEFLSQRKDAIAAVAATSGVQKVIKGSGRQVKDKLKSKFMFRSYLTFFKFYLDGNPTTRKKRAGQRSERENSKRR